MAVYRGKKTTVAHNVRDYLIATIERDRAAWFARGAASWLVDNVYPPDRIAALRAGESVEVDGWQVADVLPKRRMVALGHRYVLADRLYAVGCGANDCRVCQSE